MFDTYITGTGQVLQVHEGNPSCAEYGCVIHNPSRHALSDAPTHWRADRGLMERLCSEHGCGHPDPDDLAFKRRTMDPGDFRREAYDIHGCCGCCGN